MYFLNGIEQEQSWLQEPTNLPAILILLQEACILPNLVFSISKTPIEHRIKKP
jgi:hypothetical protein